MSAHVYRSDYVVLSDDGCAYAVGEWADGEFKPGTVEDARRERDHLRANGEPTAEMALILRQGADYSGTTGVCTGCGRVLKVRRYNKMPAHYSPGRMEYPNTCPGTGKAPADVTPQVGT